MNLRVIKIGGRVAESTEMLKDLAGELTEAGGWLLVHGGGAEVTRLTERMGLRPTFRDGVRMTSAREMDYVDMVLSGQVNKRLVRLFQREGINAVGLSGSDGRLFTGTSIGGGNRTGDIRRVEPRLLRTLVEAGYFPILCSTSMDESGEPLNINADAAALAVATALGADVLLFLSDIPGVLKDGAVLPSLDQNRTLREIEAGTITGGMIPKVNASLQALAEGVRSIIIGEYTGPGSLVDLMEGRRGTRMTKE